MPDTLWPRRTTPPDELRSLCFLETIWRNFACLNTKRDDLNCIHQRVQATASSRCWPSINLTRQLLDKAWNSQTKDLSTNWSTCAIISQISRNSKPRPLLTISIQLIQKWEKCRIVDYYKSQMWWFSSFDFCTFKVLSGDWTWVSVPGIHTHRICDSFENFETCY